MPTAAPTQANQTMSFESPLGDQLLAVRFAGREGISQLFDFQLDVLSAPEANIDFSSLLGQDVSFHIEHDDSDRYFSGIVSRIRQDDPASMTAYTLEIVPKLWLLTQRRLSRIFQNKPVPDVLKEVLQGFDVKWDLQGSYEPHNLIVQYNESDYAFISRLMEEEGIFFYFEHGNRSHKLVISNKSTTHPAIEGAAKLIYDRGKSTSKDGNRILDWEKTQEIRPTKYRLRDHSFELTGKELEAEKAAQTTANSGTVSHQLQVNGQNLEVYEFPGAYAQRFDGVEAGSSALQKNFSEQDRLAKLRIDQETVGSLQSSGASDCPFLICGSEFEVANHPHANGKYLLTSVTHHAISGGGYRGGGNSGEGYNNHFTCIPTSVPFRPRRITPRPVIHGLQSAVVTGPPGEEIYVDKYGRVRIQFHWDREGEKNEKSTCWVRVAQTWSGQQWGSFFWPRIGHEVLVAFMEGDPDQPVIVGSVYNDANMPPYALPDNKTRSGIKTRSSLKGTDQNFNELRFEDKKGSEEIYVHAERDMNRVVENNDTVKIGFSDKDKGDQTTEIFNNQTYRVGADQCSDGSQDIFVWNNQFIGVGAGEGKNADGTQSMSIWNTQTMNIGAGKGQSSDGSQVVNIWKNRTVTLNTGNDALTLDKGNRETTLSMGNDSLSIKMGNQTTKLDLGASSTEAMQAIELKVGQSSIKIDQMGVTIKGMMIKVEGTVQTSVKGLMTQVNGDAMLTVKGALTMIN